jgi:ribosome-associated protein
MSEAAAKKDIQKLQRAIVDGLEDVKAQDIRVFNTEHLTPLFERVIVASGTSNRQTKALAASVRDKVREGGFAKPRTEGEDNGEWIIVDCGAAVAHIMQPSIRQYYNLEEIWGEKPVRLKGAAAKAAAKRAAAARKMAAPAAKPAAPATRATTAKPAAATTAKTTATATAKTAAKPVPAKKTSAKKTPARQVVQKTSAPPAAKSAATAPARKTSASTPARRAAPRRTDADLPTVVVNKPTGRKTATASARTTAAPAARKSAPRTGR